MIKGMVLNIQHFCTHDGPGIRTNVFLKGCSLRCKWCSNPESIHSKPELAYNAGKCIGEKQCRFCLKNVCPESAIYVIGSGDRPDDKVRINWDLCTNCGKCVDVCPSKALTFMGSEMTVDEAAPPPVSMRSNRAPAMVSTNRSFFSRRIPRRAWTQSGSSWHR